MQIGVHLLLLGAGGPVGCDLVKGSLHTYHPLGVHHNGVPAFVAEHEAAEQAHPNLLSASMSRESAAFLVPRVSAIRCQAPRRACHLR